MYQRFARDLINEATPLKHIFIANLRANALLFVSIGSPCATGHTIVVPVAAGPGACSLSAHARMPTGRLVSCHLSLGKLDVPRFMIHLTATIRERRIFVLYACTYTSKCVCIFSNIIFIKLSERARPKYYSVQR